MNPERWRRVEEIYQSALEKSPEDRIPYLAGACGDDTALNREVAALIRRSESAHSPLDELPWKLLESTALETGTALGPYRILQLVGSGGMGRVYKAIDTRLGRTVALKIAKSQFSERFQREARAISALSHPHICTLYDIGPDYLVMEYLEGTPLQGPLPVSKALPIAIAVAGALDAAHRGGVIHCDLKPANILLTKSGPKLLDFGLAQVQEEEAAPTGGIAGTPSYMAPEQVEGRSADARTDIFAFGATLCELLTGHRASEARDSGQLHPAALEHLVDRCLATDPDARWQSMRDVKLELEWIASTTNHAATRPPKRWAGIAAAAGLIAVAAGALYFAHQPAPQSAVVRFAIQPPRGQHFSFATPIWLSPDGRNLLYTAFGAGDIHRRIHHFSTGEASELADPPDGAYGPWSPSGDSFLVYGSERLLRMDGTTGAQVEVLREPLTSVAGTPDGSYILGVPGRGLFWAPPGRARKLVVPAKPGKPQPIVTQALPDGRTFLFWVHKQKSVETWAGATDGRSPKLLLPNPARYAAPGYLLYMVGDALVAQAFDLHRAEPAGDPRNVVSGVARDLPTSQGIFTVSENGVLAFLPDRPQPQSTRVAIFSRSGTVLGQVGELGDYVNPALSPDGRRLAVSVRATSGSRDVWVFDLERQSNVRLTFDSPDNNNPTWSPDGTQIAYSAEHEGHHDIYVRSSAGDGSERPLQRTGVDINPLDWSRDGKSIVYNSANAETQRDLWRLPMDGRPGGASRLLEPTVRQDWASLSPDGHWLLYRAYERGQGKIVLRTFPPDGREWQVSPGGSRQAAWRGDSREIYFDRAGSLMAVPFQATGSEAGIGTPHELFRLPEMRPEGRNWYTGSPDGQRFFIVTALADTRGPIEIILNWPSLLNRR
ncbi:putative Serine/threonine protein kinase [Candidatus Sulfopaludibacter sp. SbA3]|nr:putative Serine/threonine protein kinase [Candidatus Sulfopaludibacter sp. SbA3]